MSNPYAHMHYFFPLFRFCYFYMMLDLVVTAYTGFDAQQSNKHAEPCWSWYSGREEMLVPF